MLRILPYTSDIYKNMEDGTQKLVAAGIQRHSQIEMDLIDDITEYVNEKGKIVKNKSVIVHRELGTMVIDIPVEELWLTRAQQNGFSIRGFDIERNDKTKNKNGRKETNRTRREKPHVKGVPTRKR
jgi:hypothetical protein